MSTLKFVLSFVFLSGIFFLNGCNPARPGKLSKDSSSTPQKVVIKDSVNKFIHVFVALCDNKYQGIVPVNANIGNGQNPSSNLYWGCGLGVSTMFKRSAEWTLIKSYKRVDSFILERLVFKHKTQNYYLVADAYDGQFIAQCAENAMYSINGKLADTLMVNNKPVGIYGNAQLVAFCGHNLLMDDIRIAPQMKESWDSVKRDAIVIACASKPYFSDMLQSVEANPLVWSTGLMSAEAYTLHDALSGYVKGESPNQVRLRAAAAYHQYQKCGLGAARNLLVTGY